MQNIEHKIAKLDIEKRAYINGAYAQSHSGNTLKKVSPCDGRDLSGLSACDAKDIDNAVAIALKRFQKKAWVNTSAQDKKLIGLKIAQLMEESKEELALLDTIETGRSFKNFYNDSIPKAIEVVRYFSESIDKIYDIAIPPRPNATSTITREPLGVVGVITPWNDPLVVTMWKVIPALLMGNSVVLKPAEQSSFSIIKVAELFTKAGIPKGVFNVVPGLGEVAGKALALHMDVRGIFFTGSSIVGKLILQYSGQSNMKKVGLECGGKSPYIVSSQCNDLKKAAKTLAKNMFYNQGQICSAPSRAIIDHRIKTEFLSLVRDEMKLYIPNNPFDTDTEVGCLISNKQKNHIQKYIDAATLSSTKSYTCPASGSMHEKAIYITPTIIELEDNACELAQDEIFGPVLVIMTSQSLNEAIQIANTSKYGLAASIWTNDIDEAHLASRELEAGIVHINSYGEDDNTVPFGGIKESGIGNDKSILAFDEYSYLKTTWTYFDTEKNPL